MKTKFISLVLLSFISLGVSSGCSTAPEGGLEFTVTFNSNGGGEISSQIIDKGGKAIEPQAPTMADNVFVGWFKEAELANQWFFDFDTVSSDITLYAKWNPAPTFMVIFNSLGGSKVESASVVKDGNVAKPDDPTRDGYTFGAWYKEPACTNEWDFTTDVVTKNTTLFASWVKVDHEVAVLPETYQTIKGWGIFPTSVSSAWSNKTAAHTALYKDLGITQFRIELRGQYGNADGSLIEGGAGMDNHLTMLKVAKDNGMEKYSMHVWSPPAAMKNNGDISGWMPDGKTKARLLPEFEDEFCEWIVNAIDYSIGNGYKAPMAVSFQNEPDVTTHYQSCNYEDEDQDGGQYRRVAIRLRETLDAAGYSETIILGPEGGAYVTSLRWLGDNNFEFLKDDDYNKALGAFCSHSYMHPNPNSWVTSDATLRKYIDGCSEYPEKERWQTEFCLATLPSDSQTDRAIDCFRIFASDLGWVQANYWSWWLGHDTRYAITVSGQEVLLGGNGVSSVTKNSLYYLFQKIFTNVLPGSQMQRMSTTDTAVTNSAAVFTDMVAFKTAKGTVALFINTGAKDKTYKFSGLSGDTVKIYSANSDKDELDELDVLNGNGGTVVTIPARSVNVIVSE